MLQEGNNHNIDFNMLTSKSNSLACRSFSGVLVDEQTFFNSSRCRLKSSSSSRGLLQVAGAGFVVVKDLALRFPSCLPFFCGGGWPSLLSVFSVSDASDSRPTGLDL